MVSGPDGSHNHPGIFFQTPGVAGGMTECDDSHPALPTRGLAAACGLWIHDGHTTPHPKRVKGTGGPNDSVADHDDMFRLHILERSEICYLPMVERPPSI